MTVGVQVEASLMNVGCMRSMPRRPSIITMRPFGPRELHERVIDSDVHTTHETAENTEDPTQR